MEELKGIWRLINFTIPIKAASRSRAVVTVVTVVTVNITNAKLIGETPDITKDERNFGCLLAKGNLP